jgi:hypothetical protein
MDEITQNRWNCSRGFKLNPFTSFMSYIQEIGWNKNEISQMGWKWDKLMISEHLCINEGSLFILFCFSCWYPLKHNAQMHSLSLAFIHEHTFIEVVHLVFVPSIVLHIFQPLWFNNYTNGFGNEFETIRLSVMSNIVTILHFFVTVSITVVHLDKFPLAKRRTGTGLYRLKTNNEHQSISRVLQTKICTKWESTLGFYGFFKDRFSVGSISQGRRPKYQVLSK